MLAQRTSPAIPILLHAKQVEFLRSDAVVRGYVGGRGAGKSYIGAYDLLKRAKPDRLYLFAAPTYKQLRDSSLRTFKDLCGQLGRLVSINHTDKWCKIKTNDGGVAEVSFRSTEDPEALRGPNLSGAWFDEASLMKEEAFNVTLGCLRESGEMGWFSATFTPKGKRHWTHKLFVESPMLSTGLFHSKTSENPFLPEEFEGILRSRYSADKAAQELTGQFIDVDGQLVSYEAMMNCTDSGCLWRDPFTILKTGLLYIGWDLGRSRNRSVIWTWERLGDVAYCRECKVMHNVPYDQQEEEFRKRVNRPNVARVVIDAGFVGGVYAERYAKLLGQHRVEGVHLNGHMQGHLAELLANAFDKRRVRIPDDDEVRDDFSLVGQTEVRNGRSYLAAESVQEDETFGHADRFWAAALAFKGFEESVAPPARMIVPRVVKRY